MSGYTVKQLLEADFRTGYATFTKGKSHILDYHESIVVTMCGLFLGGNYRDYTIEVEPTKDVCKICERKNM